jgi:CTP synthase (UTP-ammonia lyase)
VLGIREADFEETSPASSALLITRLACSLAGVEQNVFILPDTLASGAYGKDHVTELFTCNYGLNEEYRGDIIKKGLGISGKDGNGNARIVESASHRFFVATLFLPQISSKPGNPHPLIFAFLKDAWAFRALRQDNEGKA